MTVDEGEWQRSGTTKETPYQRRGDKKGEKETLGQHTAKPDAEPPWCPPNATLSEKWP